MNWVNLRNDLLYDVVGTVNSDFSLSTETIKNWRAEIGLSPNVPFQQDDKVFLNDCIELMQAQAYRLTAQEYLLSLHRSDNR